MKKSLPDMTFEEYYASSQGDGQEIDPEIAIIYSGKCSPLQHTALRREKLRRAISIEKRIRPKPSLQDQLFASLRRPHRNIYSRGHEVHNPGTTMTKHPDGASPVVARGFAVQAKSSHSIFNGGPSTEAARPSTDINRSLSPVVMASRTVSRAASRAGSRANSAAPSRRTSFNLFPHSQDHSNHNSHNHYYPAEQQHQQLSPMNASLALSKLVMSDEYDEEVESILQQQERSGRPHTHNMGHAGLLGTVSPPVMPSSKWRTSSPPSSAASTGPGSPVYLSLSQLRKMSPLAGGAAAAGRSEKYDFETIRHVFMGDKGCVKGGLSENVAMLETRRNREEKRKQREEHRLAGVGSVASSAVSSMSRLMRPSGIHRSTAQVKSFGSTLVSVKDRDTMKRYKHVAKPLEYVASSSPALATSSLIHVDLPPYAEYILDDSRFISTAPHIKKQLYEKYSQEDRRYLGQKHFAHTASPTGFHSSSSSLANLHSPHAGSRSVSGYTDTRKQSPLGHSNSHVLGHSRSHSSFSPGSPGSIGGSLDSPSLSSPSALAAASSRPDSPLSVEYVKDFSPLIYIDYEFKLSRTPMHVQRHKILK